MLELLKKYNRKGRFLFNSKESLREVCNAPNDASGIYIIYGLSEGKSEELIYIGRSGRLNKDETMFIRKAGLGGMKDRIVNGHQFGKVPRRISWPTQMKLDKINTLDIHWYITHNELCNDCPRIIENQLLKSFFEMHKRLPKWNKEL